jgi:hypothetical protein
MQGAVGDMGYGRSAGGAGGLQWEECFVCCDIM